MDLAHDLASFVLFFLFICAVVLAVVGVLYFVWRGLLLPALSYLVRKGILQPVVGPASATRERSVSGLSRHFIEFDCHRVERTSFRTGVSPAEVQRLFT